MVKHHIIKPMYKGTMEMGFSLTEQKIGIVKWVTMLILYWCKFKLPLTEEGFWWFLLKVCDDTEPGWQITGDSGGHLTTCPSQGETPGWEEILIMSTRSYYHRTTAPRHQRTTEPQNHRTTGEIKKNNIPDTPCYHRQTVRVFNGWVFLWSISPFIFFLASKWRENWKIPII